MPNKPWPEHYRVVANISDCGLYRYVLRIDFKFPLSKPRLMGMIMLNPSDADHLRTDPTAVRVVGFAEREGFDGVVIGNPYAFRATDPKELLNAIDPVGPKNEKILRLMLFSTEKMVVGWGTNLGFNPARQKFLLAADEMRVDLWCLGKTKSGEPRHPLYLKSDTPLEIWRKANAD